MSGFEREPQEMPVYREEGPKALHISLTRSSKDPYLINAAVVIYDTSDPRAKPKIPEVGVTMQYSIGEVLVLGYGDIKSGRDRICYEIGIDERSLVERAMDERRPLQDELDLYYYPQAPHLDS